MWDLIVSVPDHCLSFYLQSLGFNVLRTSLECFIDHNRFVPSLSYVVSQ